MPGRAVTDRHGLVVVAHVAKAHGIRGELCMDIHASSPLLFQKGRTLFVAAPVPPGAKPGAKVGARPLARPRPFVVTGSRQHTDRLLLTLAGIDDRNAAEGLRGAEVLIAEADLPPPDEGEVYLHKLLGARVFLGDDTPVGTFEDILDTPGQLTWVIRHATGAEILLPAVPEFILGLDAEKGEIHIDPPAGLIELYLDPAAGKAAAGPSKDKG